MELVHNLAELRCLDQQFIFWFLIISAPIFPGAFYDEASIFPCFYFFFNATFF